jgi:site-specific DNA-methyltransferase (adenine-specific)
VNKLKDRVNAWGGTKSFGVQTERMKDGTLKRRNQIEVAEVGHRLNIWKYANGFGNEEVTEHPAPFPLPLAKDHVTSWSNPGDVVLDPFCGSGTTPIAAKELERLWCGIEVEPKYCAIAEGRLSQDVLRLETCAMRPNDQAHAPRT